MKTILKEFKIIGHNAEYPELKLFLIGYMDEPSGVYTLISVGKMISEIDPDKALLLESLLEDSLDDWVITKPYAKR